MEEKKNQHTNTHRFVTESSKQRCNDQPTTSYLTDVGLRHCGKYSEIICLCFANIFLTKLRFFHGIYGWNGGGGGFNDRGKLPEKNEMLFPFRVAPVICRDRRFSWPVKNWENNVENNTSTANITKIDATGTTDYYNNNNNTNDNSRSTYIHQQNTFCIIFTVKELNLLNSLPFSSGKLWFLRAVSSPILVFLCFRRRQRFVWLLFRYQGEKHIDSGFHPASAGQNTLF